MRDWKRRLRDFGFCRKTSEYPAKCGIFAIKVPSRKLSILISTYFFSADIEFPPPPPLDLPLILPESIDEIGRNATESHSTDLATTEPSVEEASSRFGVSLRKREPSTDTCNPLSLAVNETTSNNIISSGRNKKTIRHETPFTVERKEWNGKLKKQYEDVPISIDYHGSNNNNMNKSNDDIGQVFKESSDNIPKCEITGKILKANLRKVNPSKKACETQNLVTDSVSFNFKSRLRRVENSNDIDSEEQNVIIDKRISEEQCTVLKKKQSCDLFVNTNDRDTESDICKSSIKDLNRIDTNKLILNFNENDYKEKSDEELKKIDEDEKRRSTGSINSLKKLWEAHKSNEDDANKKPLVPTKPLVSIYATPIAIKLSPPTSTSSMSLVRSDNSTPKMNREAIFELLQLLEITLKIPTHEYMPSQWVQLSEKLHLLHTSCASFADEAEMAPHLKFQFRELLSKIEQLSRNLRSGGSKSSQDIVCEVQVLLKQISNILEPRTNTR